ncbi:MAG: RNA-binding S4 domain-containing protein [Planktomarina sp.]
MSDTKPGLRVDKWLWQARFFKTRSLAAKIVQTGKVRINSTPISKPARLVVPGDVLTFPKEDDIRVIKVVALGERRGPAPEAQGLYTDLEPPKPKVKSAASVRPDHRPTGRDRRAMEKFKQGLEQND